MEKQRTLHLMGTIIQLWVRSADADQLLDSAEEKLRDDEKRFSANDPASQLMQLNRSAAAHPFKTDRDLFELIKIGKEQSLVPDSFLNIAIGPLIKEWRVGFKDAHYPNEEKIQELLKKIDPRKIYLDEAEQTVSFETAGMEIDLGALAKGYFADQIIDFFKSAGAQAAFIDLGGNVLTYGEAPMHKDGEWRVGIQNPFLPRGNYAAAVKIKNKSVVTSGIYERKFEWQGQLYHHIFDSRTGYPIQSQLASLTIISEESLTGEIWTTRLFGQTPQEIIRTLNQFPDIDGIVITTDGDLAYSRGLQGSIEL